MSSPVLSADTVLTRSLDEVVGAATPVVSVAPVSLEAPGRTLGLQVRVSAPATGSDLPVIVFSHGNGQSLDSYAPLVSHWASHGFVVVQPTHLDSRRNGITLDDPRYPTIWSTRVDDLGHVIDQLETIEAAVPGLAGRLDRTRIAAVGHSWGGQSVGMLLGARVLGADNAPGQSRTDPRVTAGILLTSTGTGGTELNPFAAEHFPFMNPDFAQLFTPTLVVAGDHDQSRMSSRGPDWFTDAYVLSPGASDLLTMFGAEHGLGGISGYEVAETTDENPERVAVVARLTTTYLRSALNEGDDTWARATAVLAGSDEPIGRVDSK